MSNAQTDAYADSFGYDMSLIAPDCEHDDCDNHKRDRMCKYCKHGPSKGEHCYYWRYDKNGSNHHQHPTQASQVMSYIGMAMCAFGLLGWVTGWQVFSMPAAMLILAFIPCMIWALICETVEPQMKDELKNSTFRQEMGYIMQRDGKGVPRVFVYRGHNEDESDTCRCQERRIPLKERTRQ